MKTVTAAIALRDGKVLLARRAAGQSQAGCWEFPGGKLEQGESLQDCLARELEEELNVAAIVGDVYAENIYHYDSGSIRLVGLFTEIPDIPCALNVHDEIEWVPLAHLTMYELAPADIARLLPCATLRYGAAFRRGDG